MRFYTNITHELRTPLTLILGPLEDMQKDTSLPTRQAQKLSVIHQSALRLLNLINQILEFRKTETQNKKLCVCKSNIAPLVHEIGLKYKELNQKKAIDFQIQIEKEEMLLFFDKEIITIILDNLISNAIKYTEHGTITISTVSYEMFTRIDISDTGSGIPENEQAKIFSRFYRSNAVQEQEGVGIGLYLARQIISGESGYIKVASVPGKGSTFSIFLPK